MMHCNNIDTDNDSNEDDEDYCDTCDTHRIMPAALFRVHVTGHFTGRTCAPFHKYVKCLDI